MVKFTWSLMHDTQKPNAVISRDVEMPVLPRTGEFILAGEDYVQVGDIHHDPLTREILVDCDCPSWPIMIRTLRSTNGSGWTITGDGKKELLSYLEDPDKPIPD